MKSVFKILIVEDSPNFRRILKEMLRDRFPSVVIDEAADGEEALRKLDASAPDLVFMDIELPGKDGIEIARSVRALHGNIKIVMLTSHSHYIYKEAAFECGADAFFTKGFSTLEEISAVVHTLIASER